MPVDKEGCILVKANLSGYVLDQFDRLANARNPTVTEAFGRLVNGQTYKFAGYDENQDVLLEGYEDTPFEAKLLDFDFEN